MENKYIIVDNYVIKLRAYPNKEQQNKINDILNAGRIIYNVTAYEISNGNEFITKPDKNDDSIRWPDFYACSNVKWRNQVREKHEITKCVPSNLWSVQVRGVIYDLKKSWENSGKLPCGKWKPKYYSNKKPKQSFNVEPLLSSFHFNDNSKSMKINITNVGFVKCRGWREDMLFGEDGLSREEFFAKNRKKHFGVIISKDNCGDYWASVMCQTVWIPDKSKEKKNPIGIDVGIKDVAITSDGQKYENKHFLKEEKKHIKALNQKMSRRWGWTNEQFRKAHKDDHDIVPSEGYKKSKLKLAKLHRKIARKRDNYNHNITADIVSGANFIGIESLNVKDMLTNKNMAYALSDVGLYDILSKIKYKAERQNIPVVEIGQWEPSSQLCHVCGYQNKAVKNLSIREWTCPQCGTKHDRDVNASINILNMAKAKKDEPEKKKPKKTKKTSSKNE